MDLIHLGVAGEEDEGASASDFEKFANTFGGLGGELRRARVGQIGRNVEQSLRFVIEVRRKNGFAGVFEAETFADVVEGSANGERGGGEDRGFELGPQAFAEDGSDVDGSGLQVDVLAGVDPRG